MVSFRFLLLFGVISHVTFSAANKCLTRFRNDRAHFEPCLKNPCFLFLQQSIWVELDPTMSKVEHQSLFPCKNRRKLFRHLGGAAFAIHQDINFEALCVWAGNECTFTEMNKFVSDLANDTDTNKYMFGTQGMVAHLPARLTPTLIPSVTIYLDKMVILKSIAGNSQSTAAAMGEAFRAFDELTWCAIVAVALFLITLSAVLSYVHTGSISAATVFNNLSGEVDEDTNDTEGYKRLLRRTTVSLLGCICQLVLILIVLFYEIGVVNFIFNEGAQTLSKPLSRFADKELGSFGVLRGSSRERMLFSSVGRKLDENAYPWHRCRSVHECYTKLLDPEDSMTYILAGMSEAKLEIKKRLACGQATILNTGSKPELSFKGNHGIPHGWFFSTAIPDSMIQKLNKELLAIKLNGKIHDILERTLGKDGQRCKQKKLSIAVQVLMLPFLFLAGPMISATFVCLLRLIFINQKYSTL